MRSQEGQVGEGRGKWGRQILMYGAAAAVMIYSMVTETEAPRQAVLILEYACLAGLTLGIINAAVKYLFAD
jgi:hypothetical protein